jgi:signal transduction histidine kinase
MVDRDGDSISHPQRDETDKSLRIERDKTDTHIAQKRDVLEEEADEVVRIARQRADHVVQVTRDNADRERYPQSTAAEASSERERRRADVVLERERSHADVALEHERAKRKRYLDDFLAVEREATDQDLINERSHDDTLIATRDQFLGTVSHDMRSLLSGLSLTAELLIQHAPEGAGGDKMRRHSATIQRLVARMNRLVNDLLDVTSIEAGKLAVLLAPVEVATILRDTLDAFAPLAAAKRITLDADAGALPLHAPLDGGRILQVLANLVSNAIKFTPEEGRVSIRVRIEENELHFAVTDTGIGIPEDALQRVFERFRQVDQDRRGLGLGLHISKGIVEAHGGRMWAESKPAAGSTFHFTLPVPLLE